MIVHYPLQSFAKGRCAEVHKQSDGQLGQPEVCEKLLPVDRREALHRLHFDDEGAFEEKIRPEPLSKEHAVILDVDQLLPLHGHPQSDQTGLEYRLIDGFQKSGPQASVNLKAAIDRQLRTFFNVGHKLLRSGPWPRQMATVADHFAFFAYLRVNPKSR